MATIDFDEIWAFCAVAEHGSFTRAASALGLDKSKVSRDLQALEARLATTLLLRNTRSVRLTPEGQALFERARPAFAVIEAAMAGTSGSGATPAGEVRVATTPELGRVVLAPLLGAFRAKYPQITVNVALDVALVDITKEGIDLALRVGRPGGSELTARKLGDLRAGFYASAAYVARRGAPSTLEQLGHHDGLWPTPPRGLGVLASGRNVPAPVVSCNDFETLRELAKLGAGVALLPEFVASRDAQVGALVRVLPSLDMGVGALFLVSRSPRQLPRRVELLRQHLLDFVPRHLR